MQFGCTNKSFLYFCNSVALINYTMILTRKSDTLGAITGGLCLIHCLITPLIFVVQPHFFALGEQPGWWSYLDYIFLFISFIAVYSSAQKTSKKWVAYALWSSWALLVMVILNEKLELIHLPETIIYIPTISLIGFHLYNKKYCNCN